MEIVVDADAIDNFIVTRGKLRIGADTSEFRGYNDEERVMMLEKSGWDLSMFFKLATDDTLLRVTKNDDFTMYKELNEFLKPIYAKHNLEFKGYLLDG